MAKNLFTLTVKTTQPADSELLVGGTGSANAYNFTWTKLYEWMASKITTGFIPYKTAAGFADSPIQSDGTNIGIGASSSGILLEMTKEFASTNSFEDMINIKRLTSGTPAIGIGARIRFMLQRSDGVPQVAGYIGVEATKVASGDLETSIVFSPSDSGVGSEAVRITKERNLSISNGSALPTTANQASFYVESGEMWVKDGGGTATQLSSHTSDAPEWMYDEDPMPPQINKEMNDFDGIVRYTNNTRKNNLIEMQFSGEKLPIGDKVKITFIETYDEYNTRTGNNLVMDNWDDFQEREYQRSLDLIAKYEQAKKDFKPTKEVKEFTQIKPEVYVKVPR